MDEWTEWTSALAVAEELTPWVVDRSPEQWAGEGDPRAPTMVLLAHAIQATARDHGLRIDHPNQLEQLPLRLIAERLTVDRACDRSEAEDEQDGTTRAPVHTRPLGPERRHRQFLLVAVAVADEAQR